MTKRTSKSIFVTGTDTEVGKTIISCAIGLVLKRKGIDVGVMKPFQCSGSDTDFLIKVLGIDDEQELVNPYYAKEPLAPYVAFERAKVEIDLEKVLAAYQELRARHELLIVEGVGGLLVPLKEDYTVCDLICDLDIPAVVVARASLGTLNHTLLTQKHAVDRGIRVQGVILNGVRDEALAEKTNPAVLKAFLEASLLGAIPFIPDVQSDAGLEKLTRIAAEAVDFESLLKEQRADMQELARDDKEFIWHPFTQMKDWLAEEPLVVTEANGCYLKDSAGRRYLDGVSSLWVNLHGHRRAEIDSAVRRQLGKVAHSTMLGLSNAPAVALAKRLIDIAPEGLARVFYSDDGSTAVEIALKMAYQYWQHLGLQRTKFIHLANSYHGDTVGSVSVGGIDLFHGAYRGLLFHTYAADSPYCYRCPKGKTYARCHLECLDRLKHLLNQHHTSVAALIVEPMVQAAAGIIVWPQGVLAEMAELCRKHGVLLIADEVATGFGRTGTMFACEREGVCPDILCVAKGITGGYLPLAATLTTGKIFDAFLGDYGEQKTFFHGHSYTGNPLACAAAIASLDVFEKDGTLERLRPKIEFLAQGLERFKELTHVGDVRQKGFMVGIELVKDKETGEPYAFEERMGIRVCRKVREYGVILRPLGDVIVLMPPLTIDEGKLGHLLDETYRAISLVTDDGAQRNDIGRDGNAVPADPGG